MSLRNKSYYLAGDMSYLEDNNPHWELTDEDLFKAKDVKAAVLEDKKMFEECKQDIVKYLSNNTNLSSQQVMDIVVRMSLYETNKTFDVYGDFE